MARLRLYLLGAPRLELDEQPVTTDRRKAIALLAYLAVTEAIHTREALAALLWPEYDQSRAYAYLRRTLWEIGDSLGDDWLMVDRQSASINIAADWWLDVAAFRECLAGCPAGETAPEHLATLAEAAELYRGDFMAGFSLRDSRPFDEWQLLQAESLRQEAAVALERLAKGYQAAGELEIALTYGRRWLALDPLNEAAHRHLMRLYAGLGQRSALRRQYESYTQILDEELGVGPDPRTTALFEALQKGGPPADLRDLPEPVSVIAPHYLPRPATLFVGREAALAEVNRLLAGVSCRLVTLLGPGGSGKTRLAIEIAAAQLPAFADGVWFVPLAALQDADDIAVSVARTLKFPFYERGVGAEEQLLTYLRQKQLLLVMDNYEQLLPEGATLLQAIMSQAPHVKLIVTSRSHLGVLGEQLYPVGGMDLPAEVTAAPEEAFSYSAIKLYVQSARRVQPGFALTADNLADVVAICQAVAGLPLGIELAAAWSELLAPAEILAEIQRSLDFLAGTLVGMPERQRSMRVVFENSWRLLPAPEQVIFQRLAVFRGGFTLEAAKAVAGATPQDLLSLLNKSLLSREASGRFQIHELLRQYAAERLARGPDDAIAVRDRHSAFYARFLAEKGQAMKGPGQKTAFDGIDEELDNVRLAWSWAAIQGHYDQLDKALLGLFLFYSTRRFAEGLPALLQTAIEVLENSASDAEQILLAKLLAAYARSSTYGQIRWLGPEELRRRAWQILESRGGKDQMGIWLSVLATNSDSPDEARDRLRESLIYQRKSGDSWSMAMTLVWLGRILIWLGDAAGAEEALDESLRISQRLGNDLLRAETLVELSHLAVVMGAYERAAALLLEGHDLFLAVGDQSSAIYTLADLGDNSMGAGDYAEAIRNFAQARSLFADRGNKLVAASMLSWQSIATYRLGAYTDAQALREQSLAEFQALGEVLGTAWSWWELGEIHRVTGDLQKAQDCFETSRALFEETQEELGLAYYHRGMGDLALMNGSWPEAKQHFTLCLDRARGLYNWWLAAYALNGLGRVATGQGDYDQAWRLFREALDLSKQHGQLGLTMVILAGLAEWLVRTDREEEGAVLASFVHPNRASWRETKEQAQKILAQATSGEAREVARAIQEQGQELPLEEVFARWLAE